MKLGSTHYSFILIFFTLAFCSFFRQVSSQDNQPPTFSHTQYIFTVYEDAVIGTEITPTNPTTGVSIQSIELLISKKPRHLFTVELQLSEHDGTGGRITEVLL